ncbi:SsrA-binding protein SmpB [Candidatus Amesbacteria bacterium]|nr:SsrA-binding protein SmpB [Candidatus Amesbacteria bacterium]
MKSINKKARFDYQISERIESGIVLTGPEAKSAKLNQVDLTHAYVKFRPSKFGDQEAWLIGLHIYPYKHADNTNYDPIRTRKLLLHQKEMLNLQIKMKQARLLLVPTAMYTKSGVIKVELGLARGKKIYEKREIIKKRDLDREM